MARLRRLWEASVTATKRALSGNLDEMMPPPERFIFNFGSKKELSKWHLYSDSEFGGLSSASLEIADSEHGVATGIFSGNLSLDVTEGAKWSIARGGFCGMRSKKIYTENWVNSPAQMEDNSWQTFVYVPKGNWYVLKIPLARYLPTWRGNVIDAEIEMNPSRVLGMSLSVNAEGGAGIEGTISGPGDFRVELEWIKALRTQ
ncbi:probable complex I intermediate-associated protein 30 isoform X2 [Arachis ipaensis]|uniref:probable complex I intermediate-associated protein 30 isoform X2 n=1 Tax=Arachis ipaensis TaxID=130454 RepID=UPI000A2B70B3|nr:probable complex I intermediate-associated protein 30 isoform X2 [Arachis ipaensis]